LSFQSDKTFRRINDAFDRQRQTLERRFASAGQNIRTSSDLRDAVADLEENRVTSLSEAQQELTNDNLARGIQAKQFALSQGLQQNQFNDALAFELAGLLGDEEALRIAIEQGNFEAFQEILANILQIGFGSGGGGININLGNTAKA